MTNSKSSPTKTKTWTIYQSQVDSFQRCKVGSTIQQSNYNCHNNGEKGIIILISVTEEKNSTSFKVRNSQKKKTNPTRNRKIFPPFDESILKKNLQETNITDNGAEIVDAPHLQNLRTSQPHHFYLICINGSKCGVIKKEKSIIIRKEQVKLSLFIENFFFFLTWKTLRNTKEQLLELLNKVMGHGAIYRKKENICLCVCMYLHILVTTR